MTFLPDMPVLFAYTVACFVLFVTPGPDMSFFLSKTVTGGGAPASRPCWALTGCACTRCSPPSGYSALLAASATAFTVLKVVGALYLLWLAVDASAAAPRSTCAAARRAEPWRKPSCSASASISPTRRSCCSS